MKKPVITWAKDRWRIRWERKDGVVFTAGNQGARSALEAWDDAKAFFEKVGCKETPDEFELGL